MEVPQLLLFRLKITYDHNGLRVKKVVNGVTTNYTLNGKNIVHMTQGDNELHFFYDAQNKPAMVRFNSVDYFYVYNLQGDVVALVDEVGTQVVEYYYDAWGVQVGKNGILANTIGTLNPFRYRGYVYDEELAVYYIGNRYYNARIKRFINLDDVANLGANAGLLTYNLFVYCSNNPCERVEVDGNYWETALDIASLIADVIEVAANPANPIAWGALAADVVCTIIPGITGGGHVVRVVTTADNLMDAARYADDVVDATKAIKTTKDAGRAVHSVYDPLQGLVEGEIDTALKRIYPTLESRLRPDAVDITNNILYELKPYNVNSYKKVVKQTQKYVEQISKKNSGRWIVVIDMYY